MIVAAIDPGLNGAAAILNADGVLDVFDLPVMGEKSKKIVNGTALARRFIESDVEAVVIESAQAMPKQGVSSGFRYGTAYGQCVGVAQALSRATAFVTAAKWKREAGLDANKENSRRKAIERFPAYEHFFARKKDHNKAEAALLAAWYLWNLSVTTDDAELLAGLGGRAA